MPLTHGQSEQIECPSAENCPILPTPNMETTINWTTTGLSTPIWDQGQCGSDWAFASTDAISALYYLNHSISISFSAEQVLACTEEENYGCDGGWPYRAMEYAAKAGLEPAKLYPYNSEGGNVGKCKYKSALALKTNTGYQCIQQENAE